MFRTHTFLSVFLAGNLGFEVLTMIRGVKQVASDYGAPLADVCTDAKRREYTLSVLSRVQARQVLSEGVRN